MLNNSNGVHFLTILLVLRLAFTHQVIISTLLVIIYKKNIFVLVFCERQYCHIREVIWSKILCI